jgi:nucleotide-binding universal stress UspA family protein
MSLIVTITNFSDAANKAINYSCRLAAEVNASVMVLHQYVMPVTINDDPMMMTPLNTATVNDLDMIKNIVEEQVAELKKIHADIEISGNVIYGDIPDSLEEYTKSQQPMLIVIGNSDEDTSMLIGSDVADTLRNLPYPVLAIPPGTTYKPVSKICLAYDFKRNNDQPAIDQLAQIAQLLKAELHVLNVSNNKQENENITDVAESFKGNISALQPQFHFVAGEQVDDTIRQFVADNNIDWLTIIPHKHSFFERLFKKTHTEAMVQMGHVPILALHDRA